MNKIKDTNAQNNNLILISIMTYYARQIFKGTKKFEFRKSPLREADLNKQIFVYSAKGDKSVIGSFKVKQVLHGDVNKIMKLTGYDKRKDGVEILEYFGNNPNCFALELYDVKEFSNPLTLKDLRRIDPKVQLPQYYKYIRPSSPLYKALLSLNNQ